METGPASESLEPQIERWRDSVARDPAVDERDVEELEAHLRDQIVDLDEAGLAPEEAFLIAVRRMGRLDEVSREFSREHSGRLWKQLVTTDEQDRGATGLVTAIAFALAAAVTVQVARLFAGFPGDEAWWLLRNASLLVLPFLAGYFGVRRGLSPRGWLTVVCAVVLAALLTNLTPTREDSETALLAAAHLPVVLWFVVAYAYAGGAVRSHERRMDVVRFTGEWVIYYVLIALGGGVLVGLTAAIFEPAGLDAERLFEVAVPLGAAGAVIIAAWLVESKQRVVENMAPVLTAVFTPLFAVMLVTAAGVHVATGVGRGFDRELLGTFDAMLVVVLGLVLYGVSARDPRRGPGWMDRFQLVAITAALVLDLTVLAAMVTRIGDLGFTPNRTVALGLNLVLLVNLAGAAWLSLRFLTGRSTYHRLERWQTSYLPVFAVWAAVVVVALPPLFDLR